MSYVDGLVVPVRADKREEYRKLAEKTAAVFTDHGALRVVECWGDDVPRGKSTDFWRAVEAEDGENIAFSWVEWPSKAVRDEGMKKVMADPRMQMGPSDVMNGKRMIFGGFERILEQKK